MNGRSGGLKTRLYRITLRSYERVLVRLVSSDWWDDFVETRETISTIANRAKHYHHERARGIMLYEGNDTLDGKQVTNIRSQPIA